MKTVILHPHTNKLSLAEIGQTLEIRMAYVHKESDGSYTQLHDSVKCRDFLGDVLFAEEQNKSVSIYGFNYKPTKTRKIDRDRLRLMLDFKGNMDTVKYFTQNVNIIREIEKSHKLIQTRIYVSSLTKDKLIIEASPFWQKSIFNMSLYTFILKAMGYNYKNNSQWFDELQSMSGVDASYAKQIQSMWKFYVQNLKKINYRIPSVTGYTNSKTVYISLVHNNSGFVSCRFFQSSSSKENWIHNKLKTLWKNFQCQ